MNNISQNHKKSNNVFDNMDAMWQCKMIQCILIDKLAFTPFKFNSNFKDIHCVGKCQLICSLNLNDFLISNLTPCLKKNLSTFPNGVSNAFLTPIRPCSMILMGSHKSIYSKKTNKHIIILLCNVEVSFCK